MKQLKTILFMIAIAALFGSGVTALFLSSAETVEQNRHFLEQKTLVELFQLGDPTTLSKAEIAALVRTRIDATETLIDPATQQTMPLLKAYTDAEHTDLIAYGFPFNGIGFWAEITGFIAVDADLQRTVGLKVATQAETPGLGARIEKPEFFAVFFDPGLKITRPDDGETFVCMVSQGNRPAPGTAQYERAFDALSGATQTSLAMERMLNATLAQFSRCIANRPTGDSHGL